VADSANNRRDWWSEIKRRGMFHVAGLYLVSAWLLVQLADVLSQGPLPMPPEALRLVWFALILIFPVVLTFGWRYDITREGVVRTDPRSGERDVPRNISSLRSVRVTAPRPTSADLRGIYIAGTLFSRRKWETQKTILPGRGTIGYW